MVTPKKRPRISTSHSPPIPPPDDNAADDQPAETPPADGKLNPHREKVFSPEDEIALLKIFRTALASSGTSAPAGKMPIDAPILDEIVKSLDVRFTKTQIQEKLRRLRVKYRNKYRRMSSFKTDYDVQMFELGRKIWSKEKALPAEDAAHLLVSLSKSLGHSQPPAATPNGVADDAFDNDEHDNAGGIAKDHACVVDLGKFPVLVDEWERVLEGNGVWKKFLAGIPEENLREMNDKLMIIKFDEAAVMSRKSQLVIELMRLILGAVAAIGDPAA